MSPTRSCQTLTSPVPPQLLQAFKGWWHVGFVFHSPSAHCTPASYQAQGPTHGGHELLDDLCFSQAGVEMVTFPHLLRFYLSTCCWFAGPAEFFSALSLWFTHLHTEAGRLPSSSSCQCLAVWAWTAPALSEFEFCSKCGWFSLPC